MLGFEYRIFLIDNSVKNHPLEQFWKLNDTHRIAVFGVGLYSELWIQQLEKQGFEENRGHNNYYPNRYSLPFKFVLPQLLKEPQMYDANVIGDDYFLAEHFIPSVEVDKEILRRCQLSSTCMVEEWNMS
jgi:hypothetical protein